MKQIASTGTFTAMWPPRAISFSVLTFTHVGETDSFQKEKK